MNKVECMKAIETLTDEYQAENAKRYEKYRKDKQDILDRWARENARFKVGDIILANDKYMAVAKIGGYISCGKPTAVYYGKVLTKKLQPRQDGWGTSIYDDGREIKQIERK